MAAVLTFQQRLDAEAKAEYVALSDGRYYRLRMGFGEQPLATIARIVDLSRRIGELTEESPLLYVHIVELAALMFEERLDFDLVAQESPETLMGIISLAMSTQTGEEGGGEDSDVGMALVSAGADPWRVWNEWPSWMLPVAVSGGERLNAIRAIEQSLAVQVGTGNFKNKADGRRIANDWRRRARGGSDGGGNPTNPQGFIALMASLGMQGKVHRKVADGP